MTVPVSHLKQLRASAVHVAPTAVRCSGLCPAAWLLQAQGPRLGCSPGGSFPDAAAAFTGPHPPSFPAQRAGTHVTVHGAAAHGGGKPPCHCHSPLSVSAQVQIPGEEIVFQKMKYFDSILLPVPQTL